MEWLSVVEFQYNNKKHVVIRHTPFELNFGRYPWKGVKTELPKLEDFLKRLQESWKIAKKVNRDNKRSHKEAV